jgi:hypothetical protein
VNALKAGGKAAPPDLQSNAERESGASRAGRAPRPRCTAGPILCLRESTAAGRAGVAGNPRSCARRFRTASCSRRASLSAAPWPSNVHEVHVAPRDVRDRGADCWRRAPARMVLLRAPQVGRRTWRRVRAVHAGPEPAHRPHRQHHARAPLPGYGQREGARPRRRGTQEHAPLPLGDGASGLPDPAERETYPSFDPPGPRSENVTAM